MDGCGVCGATDQFLYRCELCKGQYCQDHQPSSEHPCPLGPDRPVIFSEGPAPTPNEPDVSADATGAPSAVDRASVQIRETWTNIPEWTVVSALAIVLLVVVVSGVFIAFQPSINGVLPAGFAGGQQPPDNAVPPEEVNESEVGRMVASLVNNYRSEGEVPPLEYDRELAEIARYHSQNMAREGFLGHVAPDGETVVDRYERFGYECESPGQLILFTEYESTVRTQNGTIPIYNEPQLGVGIFELWLESTDQRNALRTQSWDAVGLGVTITDDGLVYVTLNAC